MKWLLRFFAPWLAAGAVLGVTVWAAQYISLLMILPGALLAGLAGWLMFPKEDLQ